METKRLKVTNRKQFECLVKHMEKQPAVAKGQKFAEAACFSKAKYNEVWNRISRELNSLGPPTRSMMERQKVWTDFKLKTKRKLSHNRNESRATGGGKNKMQQFSSCEESVIALLSLDTAVNITGSVYGLEPIASTSTSLGGPTEQNTVSPESSDEENLPVVNDHDRDFASHPDENVMIEEEIGEDIQTQETITQRREHRSDKREGFLKAQTEYLKDIKDNVNDIARYSRKCYYLEEKRLKLEKERNLMKEKQHAEYIQYKMAVLDYKKRKLELMEQANI
ncbi:uncharacterized protein LOC131681147 [Topomyia yanbarensis]|uniref:uncharacterized protein LOC131681147 n=1 Tax=Topomyia yanbarensis TaxID=2498891 RepID=UPI00273C7D56|nr:uncharacterized protein LOC131681147 [Topomyia yanbarensis]